MRHFGLRGYMARRRAARLSMDKFDIVIADKTFQGNPFRANREWDDNALGFGWRPHQPKQSILIKNCFIDANGVAEGLKFSWANNYHVLNCIIIGGYEDCVDIVRGGSGVFEKCQFVATGETKHHFTIKAGVSDILIKDCLFVNDFRHWYDGACIDLGNWSMYDTDKLEKTNNVRIINCSTVNMQFPLISRTIYARRPYIKNTRGFNFKIPNIFVQLFWRLRKWQMGT